MALKQAPQRATAALEGTGGWWGREPTWVSAWVQAAWVRGIKVVPTFLGDDHGSKQIDKWVARYRDHAAFGCIFRENARDMLNSKTTCR